jgi:pepF/M3 family oligoendopeptidase
MSEQEEALASELSLSGSSGWEKLHGVIASQLKANYDDDGKIKELPITVVQTYRNHADSLVRRRAFEAELAAWESVREPLAACMNGVKGEVNTLNKRRGREDALASSLEKARIDREILDAMLSAMRGSVPAFRRYYQAKARILGLKKLPWWDLFAPVGQSEQHFTFDEASVFILEQFGTFSERLVQLSKQAFDKAWIDAEPREGKVGGAFCMPVPAVGESRILCNFDGTLVQVATLAHELGHAYHNFCLEGKTQLQRRIPMTLAETASIFNQTIITDALLAKSPAGEEKLGILESFLMDSGQVIVDIYSRYLFESEVFRRREEAELSADDLCDLMLDCQRETYGDGLDDRHLNPYMWAWKPHYFYADLSFYNYPYAFGLLFGLGLYKIYKQDDRGFQKEYDRLLRDSGEYPAADLAARFGIDLREPEFWGDTLDVIQNRIMTYEELSYQI